MTDALSRRYKVLDEGGESIKGHVVLPGAVRMPCNQEIIPVTIDYKHNSIIGAASGFERSNVCDGYCSVYFNVRLREDSLLSHDDLARLKPGVYLSDVFAYKPTGAHVNHITDGILREISFYDPRPPAVKVSDGMWN